MMSDLPGLGLVRPPPLRVDTLQSGPPEAGRILCRQRSSEADPRLYLTCLTLDEPFFSQMYGDPRASRNSRGGVSR